MKFSCPQCGVHLQTEPELAGKTVKCPGCSTKLQIPASEEEAGEVSIKSGLTGKVSGKADPPAPDTAGKGSDMPKPDSAMPKPDSAMPKPDGASGDTGSTEGEDLSAGEELVDDYYDELPELNTTKVGVGPHPSHVNLWVAGGAGLVVTFLFMMVMSILPAPAAGVPAASFGEYLHGLFLQRGWSQYVTTFLMFWCLALLILKALNIKRQKRAMLLEALPADISEEINVTNLPAFHEHLINFPKPLRNTYIVNRLRKALEFFYIRQNNPEVASMITSQSDIDANKVAGSYSMVKVFLWAIPIMGFIGTVIGIGAAIGGFGAVLNAGDGGDAPAPAAAVASADGGEAKPAAPPAPKAEGMDAIKGPLLDVLNSLGVAFDTTLLALVFSIILSFPASSLQNAEDDLVTNVDEYCIDHLLKRLNDGGAGSNFGSEGGLLKAIGDAIALNQKDMMGRFEKVQKGMSDTQQNQSKYFAEVAKAVDKQIAAIDDRAENYEKKLDEDFFATLERVETGSVKAIENNIKPLAEGIKNLNAVLKELNGKQVVVQKKGWFSRG